MTTKVNGYVDIGEFLTGNIDFFTIVTIVPCDNTGVSKPLEEIKKDLGILSTENISIKNGVSIYNVDYANDNEYNLAFDKQENLNNLIRLIEIRAQPIMLNVITEFVNDTSIKIPAGSTFATFGSEYTTNQTVYQIKFATEHQDAWEQDQMANELDKRTILDSNSVISNNIFDTKSNDKRNTVILKKQFI